MPTFEFIIATHNNLAYPASKREGDIVSIMPENSKIGRKVLDGWFIVPVTITQNITLEALKRKLRVLLFDDGSLEDVDWRGFFKDDGFDRLIYPYDRYVLDLHLLKPRLRPKLLSKYRYSIPFSKVFGKIADINFNRVRNSRDIYQPFLSEDRIRKMPYLTSSKGHYFSQKQGNNFVIVKTKQDPSSKSNVVPIGAKFTIRTNTATVAKNQEIKITWQAGTQLILDKYDNSWVYPADIGGMSVGP